MSDYRAQPEDDAALIVLCAVRDGQIGKSALNEVIDLWVAGQIGRTDHRGAVDHERALAEAILSLADSAGMPDSFRETDSRMILARETLDRLGGQ